MNLTLDSSNGSGDGAGATLLGAALFVKVAESAPNLEHAPIMRPLNRNSKSVLVWGSCKTKKLVVGALFPCLGFRSGLPCVSVTTLGVSESKGSGDVAVIKVVGALYVLGLGFRA
jgi:hypothetical protein